MVRRHGFVRWRLALILGALAAVLLVSPTAAWGAQVTHGRFHEFAAGVTRDLDIGGHAVMVRANDRTYVVVHVTGLSPNTAYGAHVHKQACGAVDPATGLPTYADGHYQFVPNPNPITNPTDPTYVNATNEIWPEFTTNAAGVGNGFSRNIGIAGSTAMSVVIHALDATPNPKLACADLQ